MTYGWLVLGFLFVTIALAVIARRTGIAYPIVFVVAGAILGFVPNLPDVQLRPELIFLIVLPVLLTSDAWMTDFNEFKQNLRPIGLLAIGLVVFTTVMVAAIAHAVIPDIGWPAAFMLGAIIAPTDAIAAESISQGVALPRRVMTIISGESLVNDASALIIYRFAVAAAVTGTFAAGQVVPQFFIVSIGGIVVGIVLAWLLHFLMRWLHKHYPEDAVLPALLSLTTPYAAYLGAEALSVSGVLSTVAAGMWLSRRSGQMFTPNSRLVVSNVWEMTTSVLNAFVFLLLGLQLHNIVSTLGRAEFQRLLGYGIAISVAVILLRFVWLFPATYIPRWASKRLRERDPAPPWQVPFVISWAGMRGIVSLAAALAVPLAIASRNEIIFVTFAVIFATLVVMGLTLPLVINTLRVRDDGTMQHREIEIRIQALEAGMQRLRELEPTFDSELEWEVEGRIVDEYRHRIEHLGGHLDSVDGEAPTENAVDHRLQREALDAERRMIQVLRRNREIPDDIYREIEYDLDLAELRLSQA